MTPGRHTAARELRRRRLRRLVPAVAALVVTAVALVLLLGGGGAAERDVAERFVARWAAGDYAGMYALLDERSRASVTRAELAAAYRAAEQTATTRALDVGATLERREQGVPIEMTAHTRAFGAVDGVVTVPVSGEGDTAAVAWRRDLVFPGLRRGEQLTRETRLPPRAALLARDGQVLAEGPERTSPIPEVAGHVVGRLDPAPEEQRAELRSLGYPDGALVGVNGLERVFQQQLAGQPGGRLLAGARVLASTEPRAGSAVRTTISPDVERTAVGLMGGHYGGIAALDPATGEVLALAGVAYSGLQPPGSTFKIITLVGALEAGIATPQSEYPVVSEATLSGVEIQNANGEYCGGTLVASFAHSCNSVFAPLGAELGADGLVEAAERFGFNAPLEIPGAAVSTIPRPSEIGDDLAVGSTAIGQGQVQASALQMTLVAATIANGGRRPVPTLELGARPRFVRVTSRRVARQAADMMAAVVADGTGGAAAIDGVVVAGKTGTAELRTTVASEDGEDPAHLQDDIPDTDAWFVAFAPERRPRVAVGVLFSEAGAGGSVAAPAAREVLVSGLERRDRAGGAAAAG